MQILKITLLVFLLSSTATAHNTYFLPGDAFFFARLNSEDIQKMQAADSPVLEYGNPFNGIAGCGYIGYERIELQEMDEETKTAILNSYQQFEKEIRANLEPRKMPVVGEFGSGDAPEPEINVFIYSAVYDWKKYGISIQYNEDWLDQSISFGTKREHTFLSAFSSASVMNNWRDAKLIKPLWAKCPDLPDKHGEKFPMAWSETPVRVPSNKCRFLITPNRNYKAYAPNPENGVKIIEVFEGKMTLLVRDNGEWRPAKDGE